MITLPNLLSLFRMGLVPVFVLAVLHGEPKRAFAVFVLAGVTDLLDGAVARFWDQGSPLGAYLDPLADKLLLSSAFVVLAVSQAHPGVRVPLWLTVIVLVRDGLLVVMAVVLRLAVGQRRFPPTFLSKVNTTIQLMTVVVILASGFTPGLEVPALVLIYLVAITTLASGFDYLLRRNRAGTEGETAA